jgi:hypothetical protein
VFRLSVLFGRCITPPPVSKNTQPLSQAKWGGTASWPVRVVLRAAVRQQLEYFFFSILFSLSSTHSKFKKCPNLLYYFNYGPHSFYCYIFFNSFYDLFLFSISSFIILFYFISILNLVIFILIDIYFVFHPSSNWFCFQFHTWFLFFLLWSLFFSYNFFWFNLFS